MEAEVPSSRDRKERAAKTGSIKGHRIMRQPLDIDQPSRAKQSAAVHHRG
jgi:hypothetical protein